MAKDQVEEVRQKVEITEIIGEKVALKKAGRHFKGLCPFHSEKSPSFIVSPERQSFKCFGCGEGGDVYSFLQKYEGMSFLEALESLAKRVGITIESYRPTAQDSHRKQLLSAMDLSSEYYHYLLLKHESGKKAREYLASRGIGGEAIAQFRLGWAPFQWRSVSDYLIRKKGYKKEELEAAGLILMNERGFYDRFRGRIMFPLRDHKGIVVGFSGRVLPDQPNSPDRQEAKYINSPETALYSKSKMLYGLYENREYVRKDDRLVLVEGELDVIPSWQAGIKSVAAIKGSAFTEEQARLILRYTNNVVMALDADEAGQEAIKRAVNIAEKIDMSIRVVQIVGGKDPGDVAVGESKKWRELVKGAVLYWDFLIDGVAKKYETLSGGGAREMAHEIIPALAQISNLVVRAHYVAKFAKRLGIPEESVYDEIERVKKKKELLGLKEVVKKIEKGESENRQERLEEYILALGLQNYAELRAEILELDLEWVGVRAIGKIIEKVKAWGEDDLKIAKFSQGLPEELQSMIDKTYLTDLSGVQDFKREWERVKQELEEVSTKTRLSEISAAIAEYEKAGEDGKLSLAQQEFAKLSKKLSRINK